MLLLWALGAFLFSFQQAFAGTGKTDVFQRLSLSPTECYPLARLAKMICWVIQFVLTDMASTDFISDE